MPRLISFQRGSIIYFEGQKDERVFIVRSGKVLLNSEKSSLATSSSQTIKAGEFFGLLSAIAKTSRESTASAASMCTVVCMSVAEFEAAFAGKHDVMYKLLRYYSRLLRRMNFKIEQLLDLGEKSAVENEMVTVAESFFEERKWLTCAEMCVRYKKLGAQGNVLAHLEKLEKDSRSNLKTVSVDSSGFMQDMEVFMNFGAEARKRLEFPAFVRFEKKFGRGQVILAEFEPGNSFYFLLSGVVQLTKCVNGANLNLNFICPGEIFGEMAILDSSLRSASCIALTDVEVLEFNRENFPALIEGSAKLSMKLLVLLCHRLVEQTRRLSVMAKPDGESKIADLLLMLDERNSQENQEGTERIYSLSVADIARWTGLSFSDAADEIAKLTDNGTIRIENNRFHVDIEELKKIVKNAEFAEYLRKRGH